MRVFLSIIALALSLATASAHEYTTKDGRVIDYTDNGCCNGTDCRPVQRHDGVTATGDIVVITDDNIRIIVPKNLARKASPDMGEHVCADSIVSGQSGNAHCFFVPTEVHQSKRLIFAKLEHDLRTNMCTKN